MSLSNKHAVVTGGGTGIGLAIANALHSKGAMVTIMGRNKDRLSEAAKNKPRMNIKVVDVTDPLSVKDAFSQTSGIEPISILVNNAGAALSSAFHKTSYEAWQQMINVNLNSVYLTINSALEEIMSANHGRIINIASTAGLEGYAYTSAYCAAKHGVIGLTKSLALELIGTDTTINSICPGFTNTDIVTKAIKNIMKKTGRSKEEALSGILSSAGQKRLVEPNEIALEVIRLCEPKNDIINGQSIVIDGT